jgi:hypothetical protein
MLAESLRTSLWPHNRVSMVRFTTYGREICLNTTQMLPIFACVPEDHGHNDRMARPTQGLRFKSGFPCCDHQYLWPPTYFGRLIRLFDRICSGLSDCCRHIPTSVLRAAQPSMLKQDRIRRIHRIQAHYKIFYRHAQSWGFKRKYIRCPAPQLKMMYSFMLDSESPRWTSSPDHCLDPVSRNHSVIFRSMYKNYSSSESIQRHIDRPVIVFTRIHHRAQPTGPWLAQSFHTPRSQSQHACDDQTQIFSH